MTSMQMTVLDEYGETEEAVREALANALMEAIRPAALPAARYRDRHPLAGRKVRLCSPVYARPWHEGPLAVHGSVFLVVDWAVNHLGMPWREAVFRPDAMCAAIYAKRFAFAPSLPPDDEVVAGRIVHDATGETGMVWLVHASELGEVIS